MRTIMPAHSLLLALLLLSLGRGLPAQDPISLKELRLLLSVGVSSPELGSLLRRRGTPVGLALKDLDALTALGASRDLVDLLARNVQDSLRRRRLARDYVTVKLRQTSLKALVPSRPAPWGVSQIHQGRLHLLLAHAPGTSPGDLFTDPTLFVLLLKGTLLPPENAPYLGRRLAWHLIGALRGLGATRANLQQRKAFLGRRRVPEFRIPLFDKRRSFEGLLVFRVRLLGDGSLLLAGCATGKSQAKHMLELFENTASTLDVPEEDLEGALAANPSRL